MNVIKCVIAVNMIVVVSLAALYAFQIVRVNEYDFQIRSYQREVSQFRQSLREMENLYASSSSLGGLWPTIEKLELEEVGEITYISVDEGTFARR